MLYGPMTHPQLLGALGHAGHSSKVLITDGNYPAATGAPASAERIYLNLAPGLLTVSEIPRWDFYDVAKSDDVSVVIVSADQRLYANLILTVGVRQPGE